MRILTKTSLFYLGLSAVVFLVGGLVFYYTMRNEVYDEVDDLLLAERENIMAYSREHGELPAMATDLNETIFISRSEARSLPELQLIDTLLYSSYDEEFIPYRLLRFPVQIPEGQFIVTIRKSLIDFDDLLESISMLMFWLFVILLLGLLAINYFVFKKTWRPFYSTLRQIKKYELSSPQELNLKQTGTTEFRELNEVLLTMTDKIRRDYLNLKEFTENASHEIQTPLAIIRTKAELLLQAETLPPEQAQQLMAVYEAANRLSRLNQSLILLTRIGNQEFRQEEDVPLHTLLQNQLGQLGEMIELQGLALEIGSLQAVTLHMDRQLAEILLSNLLSNAIKHNMPGGKIMVSLTSESLLVRNTGAAPQAEPEELIGRFRTGRGAGPGSLGIGLAIAKKICDRYGFVLRYNYTDQAHCLAVQF